MYASACGGLIGCCGALDAVGGTVPLATALTATRRAVFARGTTPFAALFSPSAIGVALPSSSACGAAVTPCAPAMETREALSSCVAWCEYEDFEAPCRPTAAFPQPYAVAAGEPFDDAFPQP